LRYLLSETQRVVVSDDLLNKARLSVNLIYMIKTLNIMDKSIAQYLKPSYFTQSRNPQILKLAEKISGRKKGKAAAKAMFTWVRDKVTWELVNICGAVALARRKPMQAECMDKNFLYVAMCRALGIPARFIILICVMKSTNAKLNVEIPHVASEIYLSGRWTITDPSYSYDTKKLINVCQFGKASWARASSITKVREIPKKVVAGTNDAIKHHPVAKALKKMIAEVRTKDSRALIKVLHRVHRHL